MSLHQERGGWVGEPFEAADPDQVDDLLGDLAFWTGSASDACWPMILSNRMPLPEELEAARERMILQLARFARQGDLAALEERPVPWIRRWHARLLEQMQAENDATEAAMQRAREEG